MPTIKCTELWKIPTAVYSPTIVEINFFYLKVFFPFPISPTPVTTLCQCKLMFVLEPHICGLMYSIVSDFSPFNMALGSTTFCVLVVLFAD